MSMFKYNSDSIVLSSAGRISKSKLVADSIMNCKRMRQELPKVYNSIVTQIP